jgi:hypothetical protein
VEYHARKDLYVKSLNVRCRALSLSQTPATHNLGLSNALIDADTIARLQRRVEAFIANNFQREPDTVDRLVTTSATFAQPG